MKVDDICDRYAPEKVSLTLKLLTEEDEEKPSSVLIEGNQKALRMLAELLIAVADEKENDGFSISPFGAGRIHFSAAAELGVYIHRLDDSGRAE